LTVVEQEQRVVLLAFFVACVAVSHNEVVHLFHGLFVQFIEYLARVSVLKT
jgi:hypothetical protein